MILKTASLSDAALAVIRDNATETPFSGEYEDFGETGTYLCRQCGLALYRSHTKFYSGCGWPSFDESIKDTVKRVTDADGMRIEIVCARCRAHLGHVFTGEGFTGKNTRYCVNSLSLDFVPDLETKDTEEAIFAAGCFWGVEYYFKRLPGVVKVEVGYVGGYKKEPTYQEVCAGGTRHYEAVRVLYDPSKIKYDKLVKYFFEIHDQAQTDGQGPDRGEQYLSVIFYYDDTQMESAQKWMNDLKNRGYEVATMVLPVSTFWRAETYHQQYYDKLGKTPYCHQWIKKFSEE